MIYPEGVSKIMVGNKQVSHLYIGSNIISNDPMSGITQEETKTVIQYAIDSGIAFHSKPYLLKLDAHIRDLKEYGLFLISDLAYWMVGDGDLNFKCINIINPQLSGTPIGGLVNNLTSVDGNGIDGYIDTGFNPSLHGVSYTAANASRMAYVYKEGSTSGPIQYIDGNSLNNNYMANRIQTAQRINSSANSSVAINLLGAGLKGLIRRSGSSIEAINESSSTTATQSSNIMPNANQLLLFNTGVFSNVGISAYRLGSALTLEQTQLYRQAILNNL